MEGLNELKPEIKQAIVQIVDKRIEERFVERFPSREDFTELKKIVGELAGAQKRTEERMEELVEAQKESQKEISRLDKTMGELAEAQKESQKEIGRLDKTMGELAEAQKRTEIELHTLVKEHKKTREQVGGLSNTVGYTLENEALKALPALLKKEHGLIVERRLKREFLVDNRSRSIEVNIIGKGEKNGEEVTVIGEGKSQLSKNGVDEFIRKKLRRLDGVYKNIFPVLVTHMITHPDVESYVKEKGIALFYSYEF